MHSPPYPSRPPAPPTPCTSRVLTLRPTQHTRTHACRSVLALAPGDLVAGLYLMTGRIAPEYDGLTLNAGGASVAGALMEATGASRGRLRELYQQHGDLGDVAQAGHMRGACGGLPGGIPEVFGGKRWRIVLGRWWVVCGSA